MRIVRHFYPFYRTISAHYRALSVPWLKSFWSAFNAPKHASLTRLHGHTFSGTFRTNATGILLPHSRAFATIFYHGHPTSVVLSNFVRSTTSWSGWHQISPDDLKRVLRFPYDRFTNAVNKVLTHPNHSDDKTSVSSDACDSVTDSIMKHDESHRVPSNATRKMVTITYFMSLPPPSPVSIVNDLYRLANTYAGHLRSIASEIKTLQGKMHLDKVEWAREKVIVMVRFHEGILEDIKELVKIGYVSVKDVSLDIDTESDDSETASESEWFMAYSEEQMLQNNNA